MMKKKKTGGWTLDAQYKHYVKEVAKYEATHDIKKIHKYSKKEFKQKMNLLKNELGLKKVNYKTDIIERQVYSEFDKKTARKLAKIAKKDKELSKTVFGKYSVEKIGQKGIVGLSPRSAKKVGDVLSKYYNDQKALGKTSYEARAAVSSYFFGS